MHLASEGMREYLGEPGAPHGWEGRFHTRLLSRSGGGAENRAQQDKAGETLSPGEGNGRRSSKAYIAELSPSEYLKKRKSGKGRRPPEEKKKRSAMVQQQHHGSEDQNTWFRCQALALH